MCGIAGIVAMDAGATIQPRWVTQMTDALVHRGPDNAGLWHNEARTVVLGHRRLSILDLSPDGHQPMHYQQRYTITFNGEIYNYLEVRETLRHKGYSFKSNTDTEVILAAYHEYGKACLDLFDGMFAFALWDAQEQKLFCARDRFGEKPFYYTIQQNRLFFASEMKALWAVGIKKTPDRHSMFLFINFDLHENPNDLTQTFYQNVFSLKAGHCFTYTSGGGITQEPYWKIDPDKTDTDISFEQAGQRFKELFYQSIEKRLRADVPVGTSLSGGLDSSAVVLAINDISKNTVTQKSFSARFHDPALDEGYFMNLVVNGKNIEHHVTYPDPLTLMGEFEKILYHQEQPFGSASIFAQWEVFKLAKEHNVVVLLDGQGADEVFAGYSHYFYPFLREVYQKGGNSRLQQEYTHYRNNNVVEGDYLIPGRRFKLESDFPNTLKLLRQAKQTVWGVRPSAVVNADLYTDFRKTFAPFEVFGSLNQALYYSTFQSGLQKLLRFADRNSMAFSREVRLPFLSHELVEFAFSLPAEYKIRNGWTKSLIRNGLDGVLPPEIQWRKNKLGFQPPQSQWERSSTWREWAVDLQTAAVQEGWIAPNANLSWTGIMSGAFFAKQIHSTDPININF